MSPLLTVVDLSKRFGSLAAVDRVSFDVLEGSILGIAGPNGAGKTTLFNAITGIPFHPDSGQVEFSGRRIDRLPAHAICRVGIARTFQQPAAFETLTVDWNVRLGAVFGVGDERRSGSVVADALELVGLTPRRHALARDLALFERKRLMIASAVATHPRLLMLDEPAAGLHGPELQELDELIRRIREMGITVLLIEHVLPVLFGLSDTVMVMDSGRKLAEGSPAAVAADQRVVDAYLGVDGGRAIDALGR